MNNEFTLSIFESLMRIHEQFIQVNSHLSNSFSSKVTGQSQMGNIRPLALPENCAQHSNEKKSQDL